MSRAASSSPTHLRFCHTLSRPCALGLALAAALVVLPASARADSVSVTYSVAPVSGSVYRYTYQLSGALSANDDLAIFFPVSSSSSLSNASNASSASGFSTFVLQPDSALPADGEFDIVPLISNPDLSSTFTVDFLYTGSGVPSAQAFTLYNSDFTSLETGTTQAAVVSAPTPEPASLSLLATGLAGLVATQFRRSRSR